MLNLNEPEVKAKAFQGKIGLERENLRVLPDGTFSHIPHPFSEDETHIVYDFCENQLEVNTSVSDSVEEAVALLEMHTVEIQKRLANLPEPELLWPFSNPPFIRCEDDIPVANDNEITGHDEGYRAYLAQRYGRYKMSLCGIHVNYSFSDELLEADFQFSEEKDFQEYKNKLYLHVAEGIFTYGWILTAITAASPLLDGSFLEEGVQGKTVFSGMASVRCSEIGYWNFFTPVLDYTSIEGYAESIRNYVIDGQIIAPSELYYPIRLKPRGKNSIENLKRNGVNHIELRMVDVNPLEMAGVNKVDLHFIHLFLIWIAATDHRKMQTKDQIQSVANFKNAAHYDLKLVHIPDSDGQIHSIEEAGYKLIRLMKEFYREYPDEVHKVLEYEEKKFINPETRYAWRIRKEYGDDFVGKGLKLAENNQREALKRN